MAVRKGFSTQQCPAVLLKMRKSSAHKDEVFPALLTDLSNGFHFLIITC